MRKIISLTISLIIITSAYNYFSAPIFRSEYDIAFKIVENLENKKTITTARNMKELNEQKVFFILESIYPYAFSTNVSSFLDKTTYKITILENEIQEKGIKLAQDIAKNIITDEMDTVEKIKTFHDYIILNTKYDTETFNNNILMEKEPYWAYGAIVNGLAVCSGYSRALMAMAKTADIDMIYITAPEMDHGFNAFKFDNTIYYIDATYNDPIPDKKGEISEKYFMLKENEMRKTHQWDTKLYNEILEKYNKN